MWAQLQRVALHGSNIDLLLLLLGWWWRRRDLERLAIAKRWFKN
jgi:hypothetical protein